MPKHWIETIENLTPAALTVRAQAIDPTDSGMLKWNIFAPRQDVPSTKLEDVLTLDNRFVSDRREWNAKGRQIPIRTPELRKLDFTPISAYQRLGEKELNDMANLTNGNQSLMAGIIGLDLPSRVEAMTKANYNRLEIDTVNAWTKGKIVQSNPETGQTFDINFNFSSGRIQTAGTAWNDPGVNAYNEFIAFAKDAQEAVGVLAGFVMRRTILDVILADSPNNAITGKKLKLSELAADIGDELGSELTIAVWEDSLDTFDDGGTTTTRTKVFPSGTVAAVPAGGSVAKSAFAPVLSARSIAAEVPEARIDINGMTVFYVPENDGQGLLTRVQLNAFPVPDEEKVYVINGLLS